MDGYSSDESNSEEQREWRFSNETSSNSSTTENSTPDNPIITFVAIICCSMILYMVGGLGSPPGKEVEKKYPLVSDAIFSLIATIDDKKWSNYAKVYLWSSEYGDEEAQKNSSKFLRSNLAASNVFVAFHLAEYTGDEALLNATKDFLSANVEKTVLDPTWMEEVFAKISVAEKSFIREYNS